MPWTAQDADEHYQGLSTEEKKVWAEVANNDRKACLAEGKTEGVCDARAIRTANAAINRMRKKKVTMKELIRFADDDTIEVAIFAPGAHHDGKEVFTAADVQDLADTYDPALHEAANVIGHYYDRKSTDPAYGWISSIFTRDGLLWAKIRQVPQAFREWVRQGFWKKRSVEIYENFRGTGKKYLAAVSWLGAVPPEVKGLPNAVMAENGGPVVVVDFSWEGREGRLQRAWESLRALFQEEDEADPGPIQAKIARDEAMCMLERIKWISSDEMYRIINDEEMAPDEKKAQLRALFDELKGLIDQHAEPLINSFAERSEAMAEPKVGAITMTPEQLKGHTQAAIQEALAAFSEQQDKKVDDKVKAGVTAGLADISAQTRRTGVKVFCERLKERGLAPALVDETGLAVILEKLNFQETHTFAEKAGPQTLAGAIEGLLEKILAAAKENKLIVPFGELGGGKRTPAQGDAKARALATFEEGKDLYQKMGLKVEDFERIADKLE